MENGKGTISYVNEMGLWLRITKDKNQEPKGMIE
jgi:hypothetical protein